ncbi:pyrroline-5-carboxylate reductase [Paenibacillus tengchongensis]|uniref:pyrroline-5-carboxylate reductase n=1 Tax=Paenibacillus tengchongensis TaxID=2608684 RepID=UPI00124CDD45|nr:pyrroline-5-carboxylate reductase [Paenibacillus tengchongensis]
MPLNSEENITFYGAGSMAEAIVRGLIYRQVAAPQQIGMFNRSNEEHLAYLTDRYGVRTASVQEDKDDMLRRASIICLAMKPKDAGEAISRIRPLVNDDQLIVSFIAGLSISTIQQLLGRKLPVARTMPNTSSSIGQGMTGISFSPEVNEEQQRTAVAFFESVGAVTVIGEEQQEILTGVSGSGPAYIYYMMEAMIAAGVEGGLSSEQSRLLTEQTVLGAVMMMRETKEDPAKLRKDITSPNGSTQAAIKVLSDGGFTEHVKAAVHRAAERSREMGEDVRKALQ